ncbi:MAG: DNA mismatch repair endonuclease MutL, partial [Candidatus Ornithomonoglobus sp.]
MGLIHVLDTEVSNKIAAGEVVEKPLSIVKELVENSIDAGASLITVEIRNGGISYIRVTDNGSGMSEEDAKICFLRHATSKIQTGSDLEAIYTLGFRGEALSSIGAVSKVKLYTKRRRDEVGVCVTCEGGEILSSADAGAPNGTVIEVSDLFYNTPARLKFLKKPATEGGYISDLMARYVFAHPEISFKLIREGKETIFSSGDNKLINAIYSVYGRDFAKNMLEVDYQYNDIHVVGMIGKGTLSRANRNNETFFVNKRYIKSAILIRALEEAYKNQIMISKFPTAILNIEIAAENVDINVHPTKLECKFSNESEIYQAVFHAAKSALYELPNVPEIESGEKKKAEKASDFKAETGEQKTIEELYSER